MVIIGMIPDEVSFVYDLLNNLRVFLHFLSYYKEYSSDIVLFKNLKNLWSAIRVWTIIKS